MKLAFVSAYDPGSVRSWSGTTANMAEALRSSGLEIETIGPLKRQIAPGNVARYALNRFVLGKNDHPQRDPGFMRHFSRQVEEQLARSDADAVFGPGILPMAYLETDLPIFVWTDAVFSNLVDYYPKFSNLSRRTLRNGHASEQSALDRCCRIIMSSQWAADEAVRAYNQPPEKMAVVPLGANVPSRWNESEAIEELQNKSLGTCRLLLLGVDWHRKGCDLAVSVAKALRRQGVNAELVILGCMPPKAQTVPDYVKLTGFIDKSSQAGMGRLVEFLTCSHFFLLPTRADCTPISICEAYSYALPVVATETGGIPSLVSDGQTGILHPLEQSPETIAERIGTVFSSQNEYRKMATNARASYERTFNWQTAGSRAAQIIREAVQP